MASRGLCRLEACLGRHVVFKSRHLSSCKIHRPSRLSNSHQRRYASNIVKSPFPDFEIPNKLIPEMIWDAVDRFPDCPAIRCGVKGQEYSYAELQKLSLRLANSLRKAGFRPWETVALVLPNCPDFPVITLGAMEADMTVSFVNHIYTADEICHQLKDSGSVCVITGPSQLNTVLAAVEKLEKSIQNKQIRRIIVVDTVSKDSLPDGVTRLSEMIGEGVDDTRKSSHSVLATDVALLPYSSGTTGLSKGVSLSHRNIVCNTMQIGCVDGMEMLSPEKGSDVLMGILPFYHIYGLTVVLLNGLKNGAVTVTLPKFEVDTFVSALEKEKFSVMMLVPPLIMFLGASERVQQKHLAHLRMIFSGAAPLGASDLEKIRCKVPASCNISQGYGMTETSPVVTMPTSPAKNLATVGLPTANTLAKIRDVNTGEALGPHQEGELCFKGPQVMVGYLNNPKATADMVDADGWLKTGDIGYYDEESYFYVVDRLKELIKVKGFQVPPAELEEVLRMHPLVSDVGVIGVPDARSGETPVAYIVPKKDEKVTSEQIKSFLAEKVARHKQVSEVIFTDSIPKSAAGKILRKELRQFYKTTSHKPEQV